MTILVIDQPFGQVVYALEVGQPPAHAQLSAPEMMLEGPTLHRSVPIPGFSLRACCCGQVVGCYCTLRPHLLQNALQIRIRIIEGLEGIALPGRPGPATVLEQRPVTDSHHRSFMRPLLREFARIVEIAFEPVQIIPAKARPDYKKVRRDQDIDEIQLQHADRMERTAKMPDIRRGVRTRPIKTLCGQRHAPRFGGGNIGSANWQRANDPANVRIAIV